MFSLRVGTHRVGAFLLLASSLSTFTTGLDLDLCASFNTGETSKNTSIYQTNGLCHDFCIKDYAFAITQGNACWCSNYYPAKADRDDLGTCDTPCPAFPAEDCGGDKVFGYLSLGLVEPSGTRGSSPDSTSDTTVTREPASESTDATQTDKASSSSDESSKTDKSDKPTAGIQTVTAGGTIKTVTIGPTETGGNGGDSSSEGAGISAKSSGLNTGEVVGIVVGVIAAVLIAASAALWIWFRRKRQREDDEMDDPGSQDSSSGRTGRPGMAMAGGSPVSPSAANKRNSTLQIDPRMDPFINQGLYTRSASQESINTLRDDQDYSRRIQAPKVLRATNPDPS